MWFLYYLEANLCCYISKWRGKNELYLSVQHSEHEIIKCNIFLLQKKASGGGKGGDKGGGGKGGGEKGGKKGASLWHNIIYIYYLRWKHQWDHFFSVFLIHFYYLRAFNS